MVFCLVYVFQKLNQSILQITFEDLLSFYLSISLVLDVTILMMKSYILLLLVRGKGGMKLSIGAIFGTKIQIFLYLTCRIVLILSLAQLYQ